MITPATLDTIRHHVELHPGCTASEVAQVVGGSTQEVARAMREMGLYSVRGSRMCRYYPRKPNPGWEQISRALIG